ncbi:hypothetical protein HPB52_000746 [Rhipicephalus sanguineus]|uniref:Uncharacterized protein n=1 Tax=Rhipicephalus sanguineus TaxID=34632 RepID=A0A9D4PGW8_RHISA|nr:hypothetical protein HPB52_000746 [Rhipicephalus sanguineus]
MSPAPSSLARQPRSHSAQCLALAHEASPVSLSNYVPPVAPQETGRRLQAESQVSAPSRGSRARHATLRASVLRCGGGSEEIDAVGLAANLGTVTAARQHGDVARVSEQRRSWPRLKNSPGGTLNSIRRGSQIEDEHRCVAQARGQHPGVDPVGRTARDETRAKDGRPVTRAGARPSSGGRDDGEAGTEPELHSSQASPFFLVARAAFPWPAHHARLSSSAPHADHHHGEPAHFKFGTARRAPHDADAPSLYPLVRLARLALGKMVKPILAGSPKLWGSECGRSLRASVLRCGGGSEEIDAVGLAANLGTDTAARQHGDVARVSEQRRSWPRLKNSPGTLNSIRRGSQVEDEHRGMAQARGQHPGVDPVGRTARDETRAKDGRPVTRAGARPSSGGRDDGEAGTEPELHALSSSSPFCLVARAAFPWPAHHARLSSSDPHADHHHGEPAHFKFGTARRAPHDADARSPSSYHNDILHPVGSAHRVRPALRAVLNYIEAAELADRLL